jgi:PmbA protein
LRVFSGRRTAIVSTSETGFAALAERAIAIARTAPEDPYRTLADAAQTGLAGVDLDLVDDTLPSMEELMVRAQETEAAALSLRHHQIRWCFGKLQPVRRCAGLIEWVSSGSYMRSMHSLWATAIAGEGTGMERDYDFTRALHMADLDAPDAIGRNAAERAIKRLNPDKVETRTGTVILEPRLASGIASTTAQALNGASIARGTSFLNDKMGAQVFKPGVTISDDPLRVRGLSSHPFDAEGIARKPLTLIEDGTDGKLDTGSGLCGRTGPSNHRPCQPRDWGVTVSGIDQSDAACQATKRPRP